MHGSSAPQLCFKGIRQIACYRLGYTSGSTLSVFETHRTSSRVQQLIPHFVITPPDIQFRWSTVTKAQAAKLHIYPFRWIAYACMSAAICHSVLWSLLAWRAGRSSHRPCMSTYARAPSITVPLSLSQVDQRVVRRARSVLSTAAGLIPLHHIHDISIDPISWLLRLSECVVVVLLAACAALFARVSWKLVFRDISHQWMNNHHESTYTPRLQCFEKVQGIAAAAI